MIEKPIDVLFLCTGNSARSIMAEYLLRRWGQGRFRAWSAGSQPKGQVHPITLMLLEQDGFDVSKARSKSWGEFTAPDAPELDFVFTVCDQAAAEVCPVWPGQPMTAHWGIEDPAAFVGRDAETYAFFRQVYRYLEARVRIFASLPLRSLDAVSLQGRLTEIGKAGPADLGKVRT
jgi:protein-tyrosine-phosphatase